MTLFVTWNVYVPGFVPRSKNEGLGDVNVRNVRPIGHIGDRVASVECGGFGQNVTVLGPRFGFLSTRCIVVKILFMY